MHRIPNVLITSAALAFAPAVARAGDGDGYKSLIDAKAKSVVTVRIVSKIEYSFGGRSGNQESRGEAQGVVVTKDGLIMLSYSPFRSEESAEMSVKSTPTEIKVVFENEEKEFDAELVATDKKVNLAFLKVKDLADHAVSPVEFSGAASDVDVGTKLAQVTRLGKGFDYAPEIATGMISGHVKKPRKAWMVDGSIGDAGLPVFTMNGDVVGVYTMFESGIKDGGDGGGRFRGMLGGGGMHAFVLPATNVQKSIELAVKQAAEKKEGDAPAETEVEGGEKPAEDKKDEKKDGG